MTTVISPGHRGLNGSLRQCRQGSFRVTGQHMLVMPAWPRSGGPPLDDTPSALSGEPREAHAHHGGYRVLHVS